MIVKVADNSNGPESLKEVDSDNDLGGGCGGQVLDNRPSSLAVTASGPTQRPSPPPPTDSPMPHRS